MRASSGKLAAISNGCRRRWLNRRHTRAHNTWQAESNFPIRYIFQENQGKPAAFNHGVREARGELFLTLDSDDECVPEALDRFKYHWDTIPSAEKDKFSAVTVLCRDQNGDLVGDKFPRDVLDSDTIEVTFKYGVGGEKWGFPANGRAQAVSVSIGSQCKVYSREHRLVRSFE